MVNGSNSIVSNQLKDAFEAGLLRASNSFSQLANHKVTCDDFQHGDHNVNALTLAPSYQRYSQIPRYLLTTEIFGEVKGKCYLYLSQPDFEFLTRNIPEPQQGKIDLREEFVKELDNILSAAVVTQLSNSLHQKMFGDVPIFVGKVSSRLEDIIYDDFCSETEEVHINSIYFNFKDVDNVSPLFIWVFDTSVVNQYTKNERNI
jgi:chemotaxis protein CheY-P-specific phosphatase CheC